MTFLESVQQLPLWVIIATIILSVATLAYIIFIILVIVGVIEIEYDGTNDGGNNVLRIKNRFNVFYTVLVADCKTFFSVGK